MIAEAVQRRLCTPAELAAELATGSRWGRGLPGEVLGEVDAGVRSVAEAKARELVLNSNLPAPMWNPRLYDASGRFLAVPDAWFDDVALAWEIDSVEWHLSPEDHARTLERRALLVAVGVVVVQDRPSRVLEAPASVLDTLERSREQARLRPRPAVYAIPADTPDGTFART